jgi:hypothetical protein
VEKLKSGKKNQTTKQSQKGAEEGVRVLVIRINEQEMIPLKVPKKEWRELKEHSEREHKEWLAKQQNGSQPLDYSV